jgi:hypothetical protein
MLTNSQIDQAITTRARIVIAEDNGYHKGLIGIALGYRPAYGNIKVGLIDTNGEYTGEYTVVSYKHVELAPEAAPSFEPITAEQAATGDTVSFKVYGAQRRDDRFVQGTVVSVAPSPGYKIPTVLGIRLGSGRVAHHEFAPSTPMRRYL